MSSVGTPLYSWYVHPGIEAHEALRLLPASNIFWTKHLTMGQGGEGFSGLSRVSAHLHLQYHQVG